MNKRLITKAQLMSLQEQLRYIHQSIQEIEDYIVKHQDEITEYVYLKINNKLQKLEEEKKTVLQKLQQLNHQNKDKGKTQEHGRISFYNLIASVAVPLATSKGGYYIKIYEVVQGRQFQEGSQYVSGYVATLSTAGPSPTENYFTQKKPLAHLPEVIEYSGETSYPMLTSNVERFIEHIDAKHPVGFGRIQVSAFGKSFDPGKVKSLISNLNGLREGLIENNNPQQDNPYTDKEED